MFFIARGETELLKGFSLNRKVFKTKPSYVDLELRFTAEPLKAFRYADREAANSTLHVICLHMQGNPELEVIES